MLETWSELIKFRKFPKDNICILSNVKMVLYLEQTSWLVIESLWVEKKMVCLAWLLATWEKSVQQQSPVCWAGNRIKGKTSAWQHCDMGFKKGTPRPEKSSEMVWLFLLGSWRYILKIVTEGGRSVSLCLCWLIKKHTCKVYLQHKFPWILWLFLLLVILIIRTILPWNVPLLTRLLSSAYCL